MDFGGCKLNSIEQLIKKATAYDAEKTVTYEEVASNYKGIPSFNFKGFPSFIFGGCVIYLFTSMLIKKVLFDGNKNH